MAPDRKNVSGSHRHANYHCYYFNLSTSNVCFSESLCIPRILSVLSPYYYQTLFSTDIVKYQGDNGSFPTPSFSSQALERWVQVSLPLILLTLGTAFAWYKHEGSKMKKKAALLEKEYPDVFSNDEQPKISCPTGSYPPERTGRAPWLSRRIMPR